MIMIIRLTNSSPWWTACIAAACRCTFGVVGASAKPADPNMNLHRPKHANLGRQIESQHQ